MLKTRNSSMLKAISLKYNFIKSFPRRLFKVFPKDIFTPH